MWVAEKIAMLFLRTAGYNKTIGFGGIRGEGVVNAPKSPQFLRALHTLGATAEREIPASSLPHAHMTQSRLLEQISGLMPQGHPPAQGARRPRKVGEGKIGPPA